MPSAQWETCSDVYSNQPAWQLSLCNLCGPTLHSCRRHLRQCVSRMAEGARPQGKPQVAEAVGIPLVLHSQGHARHAPLMVTVGRLGPHCMYSLFQCTGATIFSYGCEVWVWHLRATFMVTQLLELISLTNPVGPAERETHHAQLHCPA